MKAVGIIAEYNPFHNGHKYQIEQARRMTDADYVIVVMSGSFVQRGTPADGLNICGHRSHWNVAPIWYLNCRPPMPLPVRRILHLAGVSLLQGLGFVDTLCFGSECGDIHALWNAAQFLADPGEAFETTTVNWSARGYPIRLPEHRHMRCMLQQTI